MFYFGLLGAAEVCSCERAPPPPLMLHTQAQSRDPRTSTLGSSSAPTACGQAASTCAAPLETHRPLRCATIVYTAHGDGKQLACSCRQVQMTATLVDKMRPASVVESDIVGPFGILQMSLGAVPTCRRSHTGRITPAPSTTCTPMLKHTRHLR